MQKNSLQDIKTNKNKISTINRSDIIEKNARTSYDNTYSSIDTKTEKRLPSTPAFRKKPTRVRKQFIIAFLICCILGGIFFISNTFENTRVQIIHKHQIFPLTNASFTASKDNTLPVHFDIMILSDQETKEMTLTQSAQVSQKATASVILYNEYSTKAQTISKGTFVADPEGKTYTLDASVKIPGYTTDKTNTATIIPGQIQGSITAFLPGDTYNSTETDFTITSFKGTSKASKIYATATTPVSGGIQGLVYTPTVSQEGILDAYAQTVVKTTMLKKLIAQVPPGYILYPTASSFSYIINSQIQSPSALAQVPINGTMSAVILRQKDLSDAIIKYLLSTISPAEESEIVLPDMANLMFAFGDPNQVITKDMNSVSFTLSGSVTANWNPNTATLLTKLIDVPYSQVSSILAQDPGITTASVKVFPPWKSTLPQTPQQIHIVIQ